MAPAIETLPRESCSGSEPLLLVTMDPPQSGQIVNVDGQRYRVLKLVRWTGTVARLEIQRVNDASEDPLA